MVYTKYKFALTEYYLPSRHGYLSEEETDIASHILVLHYWNVANINAIIKYNRAFKNFNYARYLSQPQDLNPIIRNVDKLIEKKKFMSLDIVELYSDNRNYMFCVKKTFWISILQRIWKNRYYQRIKKYKNINTLFQREIGN